MANNIEIKARCTVDIQNKIRQTLNSNNAEFKGTDHQIDTYFKVPSGRLKLREGNIENKLIFYKRENQPGPKQSDYNLLDVDKGNSGQVKEILTSSLGIITVVDKKREIYFIDNVKFHIDHVEGLGTFVEIEAIGDGSIVAKELCENGDIGKQKLLEQCNNYLNLFGIKQEDLVSVSYSDLLIDFSDNKSGD